MEKNFVFSNFRIAPHSATPDFFQNLLKTAKTANMEKHLFSKFWDTPQSATIVLIFAEYATSSKNGKTFGFVPFGTAPHCATFFSWEFIENSKSSKHEKTTLPFGTRMKPQGMRQDKKKQSDSIRTTIHARTAIGILGGISCCACPTATSIGGFEFLGCWFVALLQLLPAQIFLSTAVDSSVLMIQS